MVLSARQRTRVPSTSGLLELYAEGAIAAIVDVFHRVRPFGFEPAGPRARLGEGAAPVK